MTSFETMAAAWITVFALTLFAVSIISYRRSGNLRVLAISMAFMAFFIKGLFMSLHILTEMRIMENWLYLLDVVALLLLASSVLLKREDGYE